MYTTIPKKEIIDYLIKKCYIKFPELMEMMSEDEMFDRLNKNISVIVAYDEEVKKYDGAYWTDSKYIQLFNVKSGEKLEKKKKTIIHESIHALFRKNNRDSGCNDDNRFFLRKIIGYLKSEKKRFTSSKEVYDKIKVLAHIKIDWMHTKCFGRGLNEGFTEWCAEKCSSESDVYLQQLRIIKILENIFGAKEVLKIGNGNHDEIAKMLNLSNSEYNVFMSQLDELLVLQNTFLEESKNSKYVNFLKGKNEEDIYSSIKFLSNEIISTLIEKLIIPHFNKDDKLSHCDIIKLAKINNLINDFLFDSKEDDNKFYKVLLNKILDEVDNIQFDKLSFEECQILLDCVPYSEYDDNDNFKLMEYISQIKNRKDKISEERFPKVKAKIEELKERNSIINIYEIIFNQMSYKYIGKAIELLFEKGLTDSEKQNAIDELLDIISYQTVYENIDECLLRSYFTEENGFCIKKENKKNEKEDDENIMNMKFEMVKKEKKDTFFTRFVNKIMVLKNLTLDDVINSKVQDNDREGENDIEKK